MKQSACFILTDVYNSKAIMETSLSEIEPVHSPVWCFNGHIHTISQSSFNNPKKPTHNRIQIPTTDDDFLELDVINHQNDKPVVALFHGLEGSTDRYYIIELMQNLSRINYSVVAVNFRSCGAEMNRRRRFYHSGETDDLMTVFKWMKNQFSNSALGAVGFSLGGNALLKSLAEEGKGHPLQTAIAVSVPYDLRAGSLNISRGFNKVYEYHFLKSLKKKLNQKQKTFSDLPDFTGSTLYDFDNQVTAPIHGFKNADDYYARCSSGQFILDISRPTLLIHSRQDPICPVERMPVSEIKRNKKLDYIITKEGGHVGFRSRPGGWLNGIITTYISGKIKA